MTSSIGKHAERDVLQGDYRVDVLVAVLNMFLECSLKDFNEIAGYDSACTCSFICRYQR